MDPMNTFINDKNRLNFCENGSSLNLSEGGTDEDGFESSIIQGLPFFTPTSEVRVDK